MDTFKYLAGYPQDVLARVRVLVGEGRLGPWLLERYREPHAVRNDGQLYDYVQALKERHMRKAVPLGKVVFEPGCR